MRKLLMVSAMAVVLAVPAGAAGQSQPSQTKQPPQTKQSQSTQQKAKARSRNPHSEVCEPATKYLNPTIVGWPATSMMCHPAR